MFNRNFFLSLCLLFSFNAKAQYLTSGETISDYNQDTLQSNFNEFDPVFEGFLMQARQRIAQKKFKRARESLAPFLQQLRLRLGFYSRSSVDLILKNHTAEQTDQVQKEMIGCQRLETSFADEDM